MSPDPQTVTSAKLTRGPSPGLKTAVKRGLPEDNPIATKTSVNIDKTKDVNEKYSKPSVPIEGPSKKKPHYGEESLIPLKCPLTRRIQNYRLGPTVGSSPVKCIQQYIARKDNSDDFYLIKVLTLKGPGEKQTMDDIQGKSLLHTEHSLLDIVKHEHGVVRDHGMFRETRTEYFKAPDGTTISKDITQVCLVLDCYMPHDFSPKYSKLTNMQQYVIKEKKLPESEAVRIFYKVVQIVNRLHKLNIVHRDLKLGNIILNRETGEVTLSNFCLGKHLLSENVPLTDQRGSPAYISPDVISGKAYFGKPSDMWALGVVLYTMLYGQFPFYDQSPAELFRKIKLGEFQFPPTSEVNVSDKTKQIISSLLVLDPKKRLTASQTLEEVKSIIQAEISLMTDSDDQVVPSFPLGAHRPKPQTDLLERYASAADSALLDVAAIILAKSMEGNSESDSKDLEPPPKKGKINDNSEKFAISIGKCKIRMDELHNLHAMYMAHKMKEALAVSSGKLQSHLVPEDLFTASSISNALIKSAPTNDDSAQVPCSSSLENAEDEISIKNSSLLASSVEKQLEMGMSQKSPITSSKSSFRHERLLA